MQQMETFSKQSISPTLAEFFNVSFQTKMTEEDVVTSLWHYIILNNRYIDERYIILDKYLSKVIHPEFIYDFSNSTTEKGLVLVYIAKMHIDPIFILKDKMHRLERIKRDIAARKIQKFFKTYCLDIHDALWKPPNGKMINFLWVEYLAKIYG